MKEQPLHPIFSEKFHAYDYKKMENGLMSMDFLIIVKYIAVKQ